MDTKKFRIIHDGSEPLTYGKLRELLDYHNDIDPDQPVIVSFGRGCYHCSEDEGASIRDALIILDGRLHINAPRMTEADLERRWRASPAYRDSPEYAAEQEALRVKRDAEQAEREAQRARDEETREARRAQLEALFTERGWTRPSS